MKIDFVIGSQRGGGAERVVNNLANYFADKGHQVRLITFKEGDAYPLHKNVLRIRYHKKFLFFNYALFKGFLFLLSFYWRKKNRPDIVSSHINMVGLATIPNCKLYGIKLVVSEHSNHKESKMNLAKWFLWHFLYKLPDAVTILTSYDKEYFDKKNKNIVVLPNPCSFETISENTEREKIILAVGGLNRYRIKGFDTLLDIAVPIVEKHNDWKFKIVGKGDTGLKYLEKRRLELGLEDNVIFAGFRNDIQSIMQKSELFMLTSRHEGLPMGLMEAISQGMACISFDCVSGPSEIIENNINGVLVPNQNKEEMVRRTLEIIENVDFRNLLKQNAISSSAKFSLSKVCGDWSILFERIINSSD